MSIHPIASADDESRMEMLARLFAVDAHSTAWKTAKKKMVIGHSSTLLRAKYRIMSEFLCIVDIRIEKGETVSRGIACYNGTAYCKAACYNGTPYCKAACCRL